ncbi:hypothetical protein SynBIOSU31_02887 [Synechococcus sp. BIOS-U3-1]|nr:hypothetical protein SynBIOSU31_02887 [Synechococcus sp. BIOS-U3-1]
MPRTLISASALSPSLSSWQSWRRSWGQIKSRAKEGTEIL